MPLWMFFGVPVLFVFCLVGFVLGFLCFCFFFSWGHNSIAYPNPASVCLLLFLKFPPCSCVTPWTFSFLTLGLFFFSSGTLCILNGCLFRSSEVSHFFLLVGSETVSTCGKIPKRSSPCLETGIAARVWKDDYASDVLSMWCVKSWRLHCPHMTATDR